MADTLLDALIDSAKTLPFLLVIYFVIEFLECNQKAKYKTVKLLNGKLAPLVAGGIGLIPQCGFSVMATDLYCQNYLKLGTLIAFFVATSDEALPILLTDSRTLGDWRVWVAFAIKLVYAVILGFVINLSDKRTLSTEFNIEHETGCCHHHLGEQNHAESEDSDAATLDLSDDNHSEHLADTAQNCSANERGSTHTEHGECASDTANISHSDHVGHEHGEHGKSRSKWQRFWQFAEHPLLHTLKLFVYLFVVNAIFGLLMLYAEQPITELAQNLVFFQSFITAAVGLVPNCASSVIICGMKTQGIIGVSAMLAGLVSNSGIALAVLFRQRKWRRNLGVVALMYFAGALLGIVCYPFLG